MADIPSILDMLDLEQAEENLFRSRARYDAPWGVYGGQVVGQALLAVGRTVSEDRLPHSLHAYFVRRGDPLQPIMFRVERDRDGRSFSARRVVASQDGDVIFSMAASFAVGGPDQAALDHESELVPDPPPVGSLLPWAHPKHTSFEIRPVNPEARLPARFWMKCMVELPDDPLLHAAVLAYTSDASSALLPFETEGRLIGPSLDHAVWFHRPAPMDGWIWHEMTPRTLAGGRGWYTQTVYTPDGTRIATCAQEQILSARR